MSYKKTILTGTLILTLSGFLSRILGFYNRIFLSGLIGAKELGIYQLIFPVYMLCFSLCCHGFETGTANLISRFSSHGPNSNTKKFIRCICLISFSLSVILAGILFSCADFFSIHLLKEASAAPALKISALSLPFVSVKSCIHGYYIGKNHSGVPAISQIVEQFSRVGSIYLLSVTLFALSADARIAAWGMVLGEILSTLYTIAAYFFHEFFSGKKKRAVLCSPVSLNKMLREFFDFSLPVAFNHFCLTIVSSVETILIPFMLKIFCGDHTRALEMYGTLTGMALPFLFFPAAVTNSLSVMLMPAVSSSHKEKKIHQLRETIEQSLHYCLLIGIFSAFAFLIYGHSLGETIFHSREAGEYVYSFALLCPFMYVTQASSSILNGFGKTKQTLYHNLLGIAVRIFFILTAIPVYGIRGYFYGLLAGYCLQMCLNLIKIYRLVPFSFYPENSFLFPVCTAVCGGILSKKLFEVLSLHFSLPSFYFLAVGGLTYFCFFFAIQFFREHIKKEKKACSRQNRHL